MRYILYLLCIVFSTVFLLQERFVSAGFRNSFSRVEVLRWTIPRCKYGYWYPRINPNFSELLKGPCLRFPSFPNLLTRSMLSNSQISAPDSPKLLFLFRIQTVSRRVWGCSVCAHAVGPFSTSVGQIPVWIQEWPLWIWSTIHMDRWSAARYHGTKRFQMYYLKHGFVDNIGAKKCGSII